MKEIGGSIDVDAPVGTVWKLILNFGSYSKWNPVNRPPGRRTAGGRKAERAGPVEGRKDTKLSSVALRNETNREFAIKSSVIKGMLGDTHSFMFEPAGDKKTRFTQVVVFKGFMSPFIGGIVRDQQKGLDLMNQAVKRKCEGNM